MKVAVFSTKSYDKEFLTEANKGRYELVFFETHLSAATARLANGFDAVCVFVNDDLDREVIASLSKNGVKLIALRCAGFNNVDLNQAKAAGIPVARVPAYSPHGVAEHAVALILALNRRICRAYNRVREGNFSIEGLLGFELYGKTVGMMGTGKIGAIFAGIMKNGFGCKVLAYDVHVNPECEALGVRYVSKDEIFAHSDIISLHLPLNKATHHIIDASALEKMKNGVMLINTSRGGLIDSSCLSEGLKSGKIGFLGLDVYEEEETMFFEDLSSQPIYDDTFVRIMAFPRVIITGHQAFFTDTALRNIAQTTMNNIESFEKGSIDPANLVISP
ncbi:MAG: 2-hydroxyacid dehydrogenase [Candidatus Omnitrophica bacterium]|nr:2-hydroxyacid dehydrogenase [Candidatus Omnitrophota bacterium]MDE2222516.1 2-hydroxyacid dehydrogenase [Candidatus Omnitrophota bacterium]